jgi:SAM-dependent methyltransferase
VAFDVDAGAYARFMGRYAEPLADQFVELAGVRAGQRALDVGCGPGTLTSRLVDRLGAAAVAAIDPSTSFVAAVRERCPGVDVREGVAEDLPFADASYDVALAQLVVHFMSDPVTGLREMGRVVADGGVVGACVWDHAGGAGPLSTFWTAVRELDAEAPDESRLPGTREGQLAELFGRAGLHDLEPARLTVAVEYTSFHEWWKPYTLGVGPAGDHVARLDADARTALRDRCAQLLPSGPFEVQASAWCVVARG